MLTDAIDVRVVELLLEQVPDRLTAGAVLLDVRERHEWSAGHAPRAR